MSYNYLVKPVKIHCILSKFYGIGFCVVSEQRKHQQNLTSLTITNTLALVIDGIRCSHKYLLICANNNRSLASHVNDDNYDQYMAFKLLVTCLLKIIRQ